MAPFPASTAPTLWLGLVLFLVVEAVFILRYVAGLWDRPDRPDK